MNKPLMTTTGIERERLSQASGEANDWRRWGPYVSERSWGTVREDYSDSGSAWDFLPHDWARSKAYRWGEDGIAGICDSKQKICFALALWNGVDPILKERIFGLGGPEGNHGEDVKEYYFYLDSTPTHSYMKMLYKYPQKAFPYEDLVVTNRNRTKHDPEYELIDTGVFNENRYWDVFVEYAKASPDDILIRITAANRGPDAATLDILPTLWFRNTWTLGYRSEKGKLSAEKELVGVTGIEIEHPEIKPRHLLCSGSPELLFTENETNQKRLYGVSENPVEHVKDAFHEHVIHGSIGAICPDGQGTKAAAHYKVTVEGGQQAVITLRLTPGVPEAAALEPEAFDAVFAERIAEADEFYSAIGSPTLSADARNVQRQAFAGLLWSKQFYRYDVFWWLKGDAGNPPPPEGHKQGRNHDWSHLNAADVISMPDKWEYPWFAAWDLAFHCIPIAVVDPAFAKEQLTLLHHEWYQHPSGQLPAYEWAFGDVNPPVQAWSALRVYQIDRRINGKGDRVFLEKIFHKLLLNFTWWVNRKDEEGKNVFQGGFLGLDNIGLFDRSQPLPTGGHLEQSDGTSWMGMFCLNMLSIAIELTREDPSYEDMATKFFEHFVYIAHAMNNFSEHDLDLWDETDNFYYDVLHRPDGTHQFLKVRSMVGLIPILAVETIDQEILDRMPEFKSRLEWFVENRPDLCQNVADFQVNRGQNRILLSIVDPDRLKLVLHKALDESEFLSPNGLRAVSRFHLEHPLIMNVNGMEYRVDYEPAESSTGLFGGNSNWRGPIWFPLNYLLIEALQKFDYCLGSHYKVVFPTGSDNLIPLSKVATELSRRLIRTSLKGADGHRPVYGTNPTFQNDPHWKDLINFYEYYNGDNGAGVGASHQTGWTGLIGKLIEQSGE